ncbi:MAG TPA: IPT/TIG domain-containing protein [Jatrophihabitans sp.]
MKRITVLAALLAVLAISTPADALTLDPNPSSTTSVLSLSVTNGPIAGGTKVTITGRGFRKGSAVYFGTAKNKAKSVRFVSSKELVVVTPTAPNGRAGAYSLTVHLGGNKGYAYSHNLKFNYVAAPKIESLYPFSWVPTSGSQLTIGGSNFFGKASVTIGGVPAAVLTQSTYSLTVAAPAHAAGNAPVVVKTPYGTSGASSVTFADPNGPARSAPLPPPAVFALTPAGGTVSGGTTVLIQGQELTGATAVSFGGVAATNVKVLAPGLIAAMAPAHAAGRVAVLVTTAAGSSSTAQFTYN